MGSFVVVTLGASFIGAGCVRTYATGASLSCCFGVILMVWGRLLAAFGHLSGTLWRLGGLF